MVFLAIIESAPALSVTPICGSEMRSLPILIAMQLAPERFRGLRQAANYHPSEAPYRYMPNRPPRGLLLDPAFRAGFRHLATHGLSFDAGVFHHQLPELADLADAFQETAIIINHCGLAVRMDIDAQGRAEVFADWRDAGNRAAPKRPVQGRRVGPAVLGFGFENRADPVGYAELAATWGPYVQYSDRNFWSRSLHDGERLSGRTRLVRIRASVECAKVHRPLSHARGEGCALPWHRGARLPHSSAQWR